MSNEVKTSSVVSKEVQDPTAGQFKASSWMLIVSLVVAMVVIKGFIYIKDSKRDGK